MPLSDLTFFNIFLVFDLKQASLICQSQKGLVTEHAQNTMTAGIFTLADNTVLDKFQI